MRGAGVVCAAGAFRLQARLDLDRASRRRGRAARPRTELPEEQRRRARVTAADVANPIVTDLYTDADTGTTHIYLRQRYNGLPVANADLNVTVLHDGRILSVGGVFVAGLGSRRATPIAPKLDAPGALRSAARNLHLRLTDVPQVVSAANDAQRATKLRARSVSLDDIPAHLHYVPTADGNVQLAWDLVVRVPGGEHWYDTSVSAADGKQLFTADWTDDAADYDAELQRLPVSEAQPRRGRAAERFEPVGPGGFTVRMAGPQWHERRGFERHERQQRRCPRRPGQQQHRRHARQRRHAQRQRHRLAQFQLAGRFHAATRQLAQCRNHQPVLLEQPPARHPFQVRFTEPAGDFQKFNYNRHWRGPTIRFRPTRRTAAASTTPNFSTPPDGSSGRMQMYVWNLVNPSRDGDFDASVMIHEYGHGVSNRLTGGPANSSALNATQSGGMGEGWSDWWALMLTQTDGSAAARDAAYPVAPYAVGEPTNGLGLRRFAYSFDKSVDPMTLGLFNTSNEPHHTGELWATVLWDLNWVLINRYGFSPNISAGYSPGAAGNILTLKLVMGRAEAPAGQPDLHAGARRDSRRGHGAHRRREPERDLVRVRGAAAGAPALRPPTPARSRSPKHSTFRRHSARRR
jgi:extracellular elastinolytic metalloproteinase